MNVEAIMRRPAPAVRPRTPLREVARVLAAERVSGLPVVDQERRVVGVVSETDLLARQRGRGRLRFDLLSWTAEWAGREARRKLEATTAGQAMTCPAVTVAAGDPVSRALTFLVDRGISQLPVVDHGGRLVGLVTSSDLVGLLARADAEIAADVREEVAARVGDASARALRVGVSRGEVEIEGELESDELAEQLLTAVRRVPGVLSARTRPTA